MAQTILTAQSPDVRYYIASFLKKHRIQKHSPETLQYYQTNLDKFAWFLEHSGCGTALPDITADDIRDFLLYLQEPQPGGRWGSDSTLTHKTLRPATIHAFARVLRAFWNWATKEARLVANPMGNVEMPTLPNQWHVDTFSAEEVIQLFVACGRFSTAFRVKRNRAMLAVLLDSGLRAGELLSLTTASVQRSIVPIAGKAGKERFVIVGETARYELRPYLLERARLRTEHDALWVSEQGRPLAYTGLQQMFDSLKEFSGITRVSVRAHICRHTAATMMHRRGMRPTILKELLGHTDISTTMQYYVDVSEDDLAQEHAQFGPLAALEQQVRQTAKSPKLHAAQSLPTAALLAAEVQQSSYRAVGHRYGVSDVTVRNRLKAAGLLCPRKGPER